MSVATRDPFVFDKYKNEEVESTYGYLSGYKPKPIAEQVEILRWLFPSVGFANEKVAEGKLPECAEGWFAIPKWQFIATTYNEAVEIVLAAIREVRKGKFYNHRDGLLGPEHFRQTSRAEEVFWLLDKMQKDYDILVVPAQFGLRHRGRSVRRSDEVFTTREFGLNTFAVGIMILTHPERLMDYNDLWIDCPGDEYDDPNSAIRFSCSTYFTFVNDRVEFGGRWTSDAYASSGSVSGFVP